MTTEETQRHLPDVLEVSDPHNVRIISHPIRYAALEELFERQRPLTATEIAAVVGVSPSVMSYHLRELGAIGIVHKTKAARDGRESPWVPSARHYSVAVSAEPRSQVRMRFMDAMLVPLRRRIERMLRQRMEARRRGWLETDEYTVLSMGTLVLTREEALAAKREIAEVWRRYEILGEGRKPEDYPVNAAYVWSCLPDDKDESRR